MSGVWRESPIAWRWMVPLAAILGLIAVPGVEADDWPQWRGPERNGKSAETGLLDEWPAEGPPLAWQAAGLGGGYSSLSIVDGRIFTMGDIGETQYVVAITEDGGDPLWKTEVGPFWEDEYGGPRATPTIDGDRLYALGTFGDLVCLETATGREIWRRNLQEEFGGDLMKAMGQYDWRYAESPLVDGDKVIVTPGAPEAMVVALDKTSGEEIWRATIPELGEAGADGAAYSSIVISHGGGVKQYVQLVGRGVIGLEAETGRFLWGYNRVANDIANIPTPIVHGDYVFASSGYGTGSALLRLVPTEDGVSAEEVYFLEGSVMQNHHGGLILDDGYVYTGTGHNKGFPMSVRFEDGEVVWGPVRTDGRGSAAVTFADDRLYFRYQDGTMVLVEATPEEFRQHGTFVIPEVDNFSWSHPVVSDGKLYLREQDRLYVYDVSGG
ncbi:MAG: PQQ-binding-like beta-propeller repeat protein [Thermoanaerobaculia bacterium]|nr:PQQ-binding-like beta-propeller repeat protein [Thermoanaerobaculia bacterium]